MAVSRLHVITPQETGEEKILATAKEGMVHHRTAADRAVKAM